MHCLRHLLGRIIVLTDCCWISRVLETKRIQIPEEEVPYYAHIYQGYRLLKNTPVGTAAAHEILLTGYIDKTDTGFLRNCHTGSCLSGYDPDLR